MEWNVKFIYWKIAFSVNINSADSIVGVGLFCFVISNDQKPLNDESWYSKLSNNWKTWKMNWLLPWDFFFSSFPLARYVISFKYFFNSPFLLDFQLKIFNCSFFNEVAVKRAFQEFRIIREEKNACNWRYNFHLLLHLLYSIRA